MWTMSTSGLGSDEMSSVIAWAPASTLQFGSRVSKVPPKPLTLKNGLRADVMTLPIVSHGLFLSPTIVIHSSDNRRHLILQVIVDDGVTNHPVSYFNASLLERGAQILAAECKR